MAGRTKNPRHKGNPDFGTKIKGGRKPAESKNPLFQQEEDAVILARIAVKKLGEDDPLVLECMQTLISVSRGDAGFRGRYTPARLRAVIEVLDRVVGTPRQHDRPQGDHGVPTWTFSKAPEVDIDGEPDGEDGE